MIIKIPMKTPSKKNSQQIIFAHGKPRIVQNSRYYQFEKDCGYWLKKYELHIDYPINLKCLFYVPDKRRRDLTNLLNAIQDTLVKYGVLEDDNSEIVNSVDGSRIIFEKR